MMDLFASWCRVVDDIATTKAIRRVNCKMLKCFDTSMSPNDQ